MRHDGRQAGQMRPVKIIPHFQANPTGSCLIEVGKTRVVCSAMIEESVPPFLKGSGKGWLTAEYSMLPGSSSQRVGRERQKVGGRTHEIQRLIGRSLRSCLDLSKLGERSVLIDCDVLDADGGTRTASISGAYVALVLALRKVKLETLIKGGVAAVSVGRVKGMACLDLDYVEDKDAEVDMNIVRTSAGKFIELQGTAEGEAFDESAMNEMITLAKSGVEELLSLQRKTLAL